MRGTSTQTGWAAVQTAEAPGCAPGGNGRAVLASLGESSLPHCAPSKPLAWPEGGWLTEAQPPDTQCDRLCAQPCSLSLRPI